VLVPAMDRPELAVGLLREGLSQQQVADTLGVGDSTVSRDLGNSQMGVIPPTRTDSLGPSAFPLPVGGLGRGLWVSARFASRRSEPRWS
jgi:hypothetical protein